MRTAKEAKAHYIAGLRIQIEALEQVEQFAIECPEDAPHFETGLKPLVHIGIAICEVFELNENAYLETQS